MHVKPARQSAGPAQAARQIGVPFMNSPVGEVRARALGR